MKQIALLLALFLGVSAFGQEAQGNIPTEVFYLLPEFGEGMVYFTDQAPAQGQMNICAVDQTLRFLDKDGKELASSADNISRVVIGDVVFVRDEGAYYRLYPISDALTLAYRRNVEIIRDVKKGAYGMESRTSSIRDVGSLQADGMMYTLQRTANYPYNVTESCSLYMAGSVVPFNKRSLRKYFPERKDDIDAWLKTNRNLPKTLDETTAFLARLASGKAL